MRTNRKKTMAIGAALVAAALFATAEPAIAGGQRHVLPADYGQVQPAYEFRIVSAPSANTPLVVQLVNTKTGQPVSDAHISLLRPTYLGIKAVPMFQNILMPLKPDGVGDYVYSGERLVQGERLTLRGHVPGEPSATWETIVVVG